MAWREIMGQKHPSQSPVENCDNGTRLVLYGTDSGGKLQQSQIQ